MAPWRSNLHTNINVALLSNARGGHDTTVLLSKSSYTESRLLLPNNDSNKTLTTLINEEQERVLTVRLAQVFADRRSTL